MEKVGVQEIPNKDKGCQELLKTSGLTNGWLRQQSKLHELSNKLDRKLNQDKLPSLATLISWDRRFVIINEGYIYVYKNENAKRPTRVLDLGAFQRVEEVKVKAKDAIWPFKIIGLFQNKDKYFSATSHEDLQNWIKAIQKGLDETEKSGRRETIRKYVEEERAAKKAEEERRKNQKPKKEDEEEHQEDSSPTPSSSDDESSDDYDEIPDHYDSSEQTVLHDGTAVSASLTVDNSDNKPVPKPKPSWTQQNIPFVPRTKELPPIPIQKDEEVVYEMEMEVGNIVEQAIWRGEADEGTRLMRSIKEDGVFMIRESTSGNGDLVLQVIANGELRKYKIAKEGDQYRLVQGRTFRNVLELLKHYKTNVIPNYDTKLTEPYVEFI